MKLKFNGIYAVLLLSLASSQVQAGETKIGRYTSISNEASFAQKNLLGVEVKTRFPDSVTNVREAMEHLLMRSGYRLALEDIDPDIDVLYEQTLPDVHRVIGPMSLYEALQTIAGPVWSMSRDPVERTVTFSLVKKYRHYVQKANSNNQTILIKAANVPWQCERGFEVVSTNSIFYAPNSFKLNAQDHRKLNDVADQVKTKKFGIVIKSYSDPSGLPEMHELLSMRRGMTIEKYFTRKGLSKSIVTNESLGAAFPYKDTPKSRQRVSEIQLVKNLCKVKKPVVPTWHVKAGEQFADILFRWVDQSTEFDNAVYNVKNLRGEIAHITFPVDYHFKGPLLSAIKNLIYIVNSTQTESIVNRLEPEIFGGDNTLVIVGLVDQHKAATQAAKESGQLLNEEESNDDEI